ncbi:hypothetical protein POV26_10890 [Aequorivita todarodis]|uniref:hypothetical protein n=1 Tax=Aequorivita todarodis TaxID=2036821 RepID=UPI00234FC010|nr:hypothetical protein [Aequorivita todarodis]MDC8001545.1 hypothetical protein [Aequorivita todarodis]
MDVNKEREEFRAKLRAGFDLTFQKLIAFKKYKNTPFVFERNGKIIEMTAEEVEAEMKEKKKVKPYKMKTKAHPVNEPSKKSKME